MDTNDDDYLYAITVVPFPCLLFKMDVIDIEEGTIIALS